MRVVRKYDKGGKTGRRKEETVSVRKMSDREYTNDLGSEEQLLADALSNQGYDVSDLTSILGMTKIKPNLGEEMSKRLEGLGYTAGDFINMLGLMDSSSLEGKPQVRAHIDNNVVRLADLKNQDEGYYKSVHGGRAIDEVYEKIAGRELKPSEERLLRKAMADPALASYFMKLYADESEDRAKLDLASVQPRGGSSVDPGACGKGVGPNLHPSCRGGSSAYK